MTLPTLTVSIGRGGWLLGSTTKSILGTTTYLGYATFDDITSKVRQVSIRRGRQHELDRVEAGTATVVLMNQDGVFDPMNTSSPYYPDIRPMVPLRIQASFFGSPTDIAGLVAWYDFSDISTLFQDTARTTPITADAQVIKGVTDKSGTTNHLSEATNGPAYKTGIQNAHSVARFDGVNDLLSATIAADNSRTLFIVAKKASAPGAANKTLVAMSYDNNRLFASSTYSATALAHYANGAFGVTVITGTTVTNWAIYTARMASLSSLDVYGNGGTPVNLDPEDGVNGTTAWVLGALGGATDPGDYDIAEVLLYNSPLVPADHNLIGTYLAAKWGITWTMVT